MDNDAPPERIENPRSAARAGVRLRRLERPQARFVGWPEPFCRSALSVILFKGHDLCSCWARAA